MWANETLEKAAADEVQKLHRQTTEHKNYPIPTISRELEQSPIITHKEKCEILRATLYQEPSPLSISIKADLSCRQDNKIPFEKVTYIKVQEAFSSSSSNTAANASQINYTMLKWAWPHVGNEITMLICQCLTNRYHPLQWQRAITIALKKPNKPDYTQPKAYYLITLLECIGKLLEKVVAHRLTYLTGWYNLISGS